jgi:hypothetical protein
MKDMEPHRELLLRYLDGNVLPGEEAQIAELLRSNPQARVFLRDVAEQAVTVADMARVEDRRQGVLAAREDWAGKQADATSGARGLRIRPARWSWAIAAAAMVALITGIYWLRPNAEPEIAEITGLTGSLQWTGNGGQVSHDLRVGAKLPGGTIEGIVPGSWFELEFKDGSTVTISGNSTLTFADHGQKKLYLKEGNVSGHAGGSGDAV